MPIIKRVAPRPVVVVEDNVPMRPKRWSKGILSNYPWATVKVNQSFLMAEGITASRGSVYANYVVKHWPDCHGRKFTFRTVYSEDGKSTRARCWRVK